MSTGLKWRKRLVDGPIAVADRLVPSSSTVLGELLVVGITVPGLVVLAAWLGSVLGLPLVLNLGLVTILGGVAVWPFMLREMLSSTPIGTDDTLSTVLMNLATGAGNSSEAPDSSE